MTKRLFTLSGFILCLTLASLWVFQNQAPQVPDVSLRTLKGEEIALKALKGRPVLITFWATTCHVCIEEMPHLIALYEELAPNGLEIISVAMPYDPPDRVIAFSRSRNIPYPIALDINGNIARAFGQVSATPASFLIAPNGTLIFQQTGKIDSDRLRLQILNLLPTQQQITQLWP